MRKSLLWGEHKAALLERYFKLRHENNPTDPIPSDDKAQKALLREMGYVKDDCFTQAGVLLFGTLSHAGLYTDVLLENSFRGSKKRKLFSGLSLLELYEQLIHALNMLWEQRFSSTSIRDESWGEKIFFEYPQEAIREALAIFLMRRDYEKTRVARIDLTSKYIQFHYSDSANSLLEQAFRETGLSSGQKDGMVHIYDALKGNLSYKPDNMLGLEGRQNSLTIFRRDPSQAILAHLGRGVIPKSKWMDTLTRMDTPDTVLIPAGPFWRGSSPGDPSAEPNETPRLKINLPAYQIGRYPVTNAQYACFLAANPDHPVPHSNDSRFQDCNYWDSQTKSCPDDKADHPVVLVNLQDAIDYCRWLKEKTGQRYRLPKEEEWEKAARGPYPDERDYPWGEWRANYCNTQELERKRASSVHEFEQRNSSPFGVVDMAGNVWEWTSSPYTTYDASAYESLIIGSERQVVRGGSWGNYRDKARVSFRGRYEYDTRRPYLGFRVACDMVPAP